MRGMSRTCIGDGNAGDAARPTPSAPFARITGVALLVGMLAVGCPEPTIEVEPNENLSVSDLPGSDKAYEDEGDIWFTRSELGFLWSESQRLGLGQARRELQPTVAARGERVAVVFYDQANGNPDTHVTAWRSTNRGDTWTLDTITRDPGGEPLDFELCPREGRFNFVGDYIAVTPMVATTAGTPTEAFFAAWSDSRDGCVRQGERVATHMHTFGTVFE